MFESEEDRILRILNAEIGLRTRYGTRREEARERGYILSWSNAAREWWLFQPAIPKGREVELDANQVFAPYPRDKLVAILPKLRELPLYRSSFEAMYKLVIRQVDQAAQERA